MSLLVVMSFQGLQEPTVSPLQADKRIWRPSALLQKKAISSAYWVSLINNVSVFVFAFNLRRSKISPSHLKRTLILYALLAFLNATMPAKSLGTPQPGSKGQLPTSVLTLVPVRSNSQIDWLFDNERLTNYSKELLLGFGGN